MLEGHVNGLNMEWVPDKKLKRACLLALTPTDGFAGCHSFEAGEEGPLAQDRACTECKPTACLNVCSVREHSVYGWSVLLYTKRLHSSGRVRCFHVARTGLLGCCGIVARGLWRVSDVQNCQVLGRKAWMTSLGEILRCWEVSYAKMDERCPVEVCQEFQFWGPGFQISS